MWPEIEARFLAACIFNPDLIMLAESDLGLSSDDFSWQEFANVWNELTDYIKEHDEVPTRAYVERVFPASAWKALTAEFSKLRSTGTTRGALGDAAEIIRLSELSDLEDLFKHGIFSLHEPKADPDDVRSYVAEKLLIDRKIGEVEHIAAAGDYVVEAVSQWVRGESWNAVPTGIPSLDMMIGGGWILSGVGIIGGRRGSAKTALAMQMLVNAARAGHPGMMISLEMTRDQLLLRYVTRELGISVSELRSGKLVGHYELVDQVKEKIDELASAPLYICDASSLSLYQLNDLIRLQVLRNNLKIVFVDYAELISVPGEEGYGSIKSVYRVFKATAKKYNIAVVVLSQLGRSIEHDEGKFPDDAALKFAGEDEGDTILLLWNVAGYQSRGINVKPPKWILDSGALEKDVNTGMFRVDRLPLIISKAKWGELGVFPLGWDQTTGRIYDPVVRSHIGRTA